MLSYSLYNAACLFYPLMLMLTRLWLWLSLPSRWWCSDKEKNYGSSLQLQYFVVFLILFFFAFSLLLLPVPALHCYIDGMDGWSLSYNLKVWDKLSWSDGVVSEFRIFSIDLDLKRFRGRRNVKSFTSPFLI